MTAAGADQKAPVDANQTGAIEGTVTYQADVQRPWRYIRYYVKDRNKGLLGEAVVALTGVSRDKRGEPSVATTTVINQKDFQFAPELVAIRVGDHVKFLNSDEQVHNVQASHPLYSFNVNMPAGTDYVATFPVAGGIRMPYQMGCVYHSAMRAWVFVFDHPYYSVTKADGRFGLERVPAGEYKLEMFHPAGELRWNTVIKVEAGKTANVNIRVSPDNAPAKKG